MSNSINGNRFPLSLSQLNILNLERTLSGTPANNISTTVRINGRLDFPALQKSINAVIQSDASLRTRIVEENGELFQYHGDFSAEAFPVYDFTNTSREGIENWENAVTRELIPVFDGPLYRFVLFRDSENSGGILVKLHHIIADGWSQIMLCNKIGETYLRILEDKEPCLSEAPDYRKHVDEEQEYLGSKAFAKDRRYWERVVKDGGDASVLKSVNSAAVSHVGRRLSFELPEILNHAIYSYCLEKRVAPFAVFYMALAIYFKRNGGERNFTVGVPIFNRTNFEFKQTTGMFVTTLPFFNTIDDEWTLNTFNDHLAESWLELLRHQRFPFSMINELSEKEGRLFNIALSYQDSKIFESHNASVEFTGRWHYSGYQAEQLTIHLTNLKNHTQYAVDYDYLAQFFTEAEITALHKSLCHILEETLSDPDKPIYRLNVLSLEEKEKVLYTFNKTDRYLEKRSVYSALTANNSRHHNRVALIYNGERMTYGALLLRGTQYASAISELKTEEKGLAAILLPRNFSLFSAMIGAIQANHAYLLLSPGLPTERVKTILSQSGATVLITDEKGKLRFSETDIPVICTEDAEQRPAVIYRDVRENESDKDESDGLAYVVYTSGSTGEPKGVEITGRNLLNLAQEMKDVYGQGAVLSLCNVGFDAFMLESIVALLNGKTIVLPEENELEAPERLAALMNGYAVGFFSLTPSRLNAFLNNQTFRKSMWRMESIVCGGEHFPPELLKKLKLCTNARVYNQYGPSEATVAVSMKELSRADKITVGTPMGNCKLYVLDQWKNPLPVGGHGRLFVGGACVGKGYRNRPDLTEKAFFPNPFVNDDIIYDTGDIAQWTEHGEIVLTGRADRQVKLRGLRIELQEVAACIEGYRGVNAAYARIMNLGGSEVIGAYYVADAEISEAKLLSHTATYLPEYMIPAFIMRVNSLTVNANGKVDEDKLPSPLETEAPTGRISSTANEITEIFRQTLGQNDIHGNSNYFLCGGNSLNAMECIVKIEERFGKKLRVADLYACRTPIKLASLIEGTEADVGIVKSAPSLKKAPLLLDYPLTNIQQGIYVQSLLDPNGVSYNMPGAFLLENPVEANKLSLAFQRVVSTDPIFRTCFKNGKDGLSAYVSDNCEFKLETVNAENFDSACAEFLRPFDLSKAPLLRGGLWNSPEGKQYLFIDSHHIVGDGMSTPLLLERLNDAYEDKLTEAQWNYYDYVCTVNGEETEKDTLCIDHWKKHLEDMPSPLDLPTDLPRPKKFDYKGNEHEYVFSESVSKSVEDFCRQRGYSVFHVFLGAYGLLLSKVSGKQDFVIGTPVAGRNHTQSGEICGPFINTLPLRLKPEKDITCEQWLERVRSEVTDMLDNQSVSLEDIISALGLERGAQNPLYSVMISQSPVDEESFRLNGGKMTFKGIPTGTVKMDMVAELVKKSSRIAVRLSYATSLFQKDTAELYCRCIEQAVKAIINTSSKRLGDTDILSPKDKERLIETPNYSVTPFVNRPIHKLIKSRYESMPEATAVIFGGEEISYSRLEKRACAIARYIEEMGVPASGCVGICLERTPDLIAAMYGVLKAGCAYMLTLAEFPAARINNMLKASGCSLMLYDRLPEETLNTEMPCDLALLPKGEAEDYEDRAVKDTDLFNVHFTSGSTGKPKGVMINHRSMANLYAMVKDLIQPYEGTFLCSTKTVFDCFVVETLVALAIGRTVVLANEEEMLLPWKLARLMETYHTGIFEMTPSRLWLNFGNEEFCRAAKQINLLMVGGEVLTKALCEKFYRYSNGTLLNMYGPSETTVYTTMGIIEPGDHITIGRPVMNTRAYVLDEELKPVLPTGCGELCIAGETLSPGYASDPSLTEERFVEDIYFSGSKMYRSGDIVRLRADGSFDYIGRKDDQIKLNGQRVELDEITGAIQQTGLVKQCATVAVKKPDGSMELWSYYAGKENCEKEILDYITKLLPDYMLPSRFIRIDEMPVTASGKIDTGALRSMSVNGTATVENKPEKAEKETVQVTLMPVAADTDYVLNVWNCVLTAPVSDTEESFFKQGGSSMAALNVLSYYYNDGFEMSLAEFYENPSVSAQVALLQSRVKSSGTESAPSGKKPFLVTGATGFFGAHLVKELVDSGEEEILCLVRDGNAMRVKEIFEKYFGAEDGQRILDRVSIVKGDITSERLGMTDTEYGALAERIGDIFHSAADVRHYAADEVAYMNTNVEGTRNVLGLARKANVGFYHMSTASVSGNGMKNGSRNVTFTEDDYDIGQIWENNIYVKSKFKAEGIVLDAVKDGAKAKIFRLGRLVGRMTDGKFQINPETNAFYLLLKGFLQLGALPEEASELRMDVMPIDLAAKQVLALLKGDKTVYHIMNSQPPTFGEILQAADSDFVIADKETFGKIFREKRACIDRELLAIIMSNMHMSGVHAEAVRVTNSMTFAALEELGFTAPSVSLKTALKEFGKGE